jgi:hypothetical protein
MTPKFGRMIAVFSAPPDLRIKYMFIVQRYVYRATVRLMPAAARRSFAPRMWSLTGIAGFGGSATRKGRGLSADQIVEDAVRQA